MTSRRASISSSSFADHQPLHRQEKMFERHGVEISRKTMGGWLAQIADLLVPLYQAAKTELFRSHVAGTDDTGVKVLDPKLPFARIGRIWPYVGDAHHPVIVYDYTPTRGRAGPAKFLEGYTGYLQADAYSVYDAFFKPARGLIEVGCWMHARRYFFKALESDRQHMGPVLHLIARLYAIEDRAKALSLSAETKARIAAAHLGPADRKAAPVSARVTAGGAAQEPWGRGRALRAESVESADALSRRRRVGGRQRHHRARQPRHRHRPRQLDLFRQ